MKDEKERSAAALGASRAGQSERTASARVPAATASDPWEDPVDAASEDSFPASDPPPWTLGSRSATARKDVD